MEENNDTFDMQDMRQQIAELKLRLEEKLRLDKVMLKKQIMDKTNAVNNFGTSMLAMGILGALFFPPLLYFMFDFSLACCIITSLLGIADAICDYWLSHQIKQEDYSEKSITEMISLLIKMKRNYFRSTAIGISIVSMLVIWWCIEIMHTHFFDFIPKPEFVVLCKVLSIAVCIIGLVVGVVTDMHLYRKQISRIEELIDMID